MERARYYLDDIRIAPKGWVPVRDPRSLLTIVRLACPGEIEAISFDHDLGIWDGKRELTGYWVLSRIEELVATSDYYKEVVPSDLRVHSANSSVYKKMEQTVESIRRLKDEF